MKFLKFAVVAAAFLIGLSMNVTLVCDNPSGTARTETSPCTADPDSSHIEETAISFIESLMEETSGEESDPILSDGLVMNSSTESR